MEEENKQEVVAAEEAKEVKEEQPQQENQQGGLDEVSKFSLITFILSVVGLAVCGGWVIGGIACTVLGAISLGRVKKCNAVKQPFRTFDKISKPVAIVDIILGIVVAIIYLVAFIIQVVGALAEVAAS